MIKNDRQYRITKAQAERFSATIAAVASKPTPRLHSTLRKAELAALRSQLDDLTAELREYESLRNGKRRDIALASIEDLPRSLIQGRIAAGLTQEELAAKLGLKPQQVQRYESTNYRSASLDRIHAVLRAIGLKLRQPATLRLVS